ncbi:MAG: RNA-directed DNA polymerase, partial [Sarcina sp.]
MYNEIFKKKELDQRMSMGLMKLIYKRKGDKKSLKNYRPITMLNGDLKILAKILSNRLKNVLPKIIETNQAYGVIGRDIADTTSSIRDIMSILKENERKGYIISLDFEKAFDRVEHDFLFAILEHFGFGENFKEWLKILYKNITTRVKCNGFLTDPFKITRSIRQGCPLSAQLYTLIAEPLGMIIKKDKEIKGIKFGDGQEEMKVFQYADDTTLTVEDYKSVENVMERVARFCKGTGAKVNEEKTVYIKFGEVSDLKEVCGFTEVQEMKILGVKLGKDEKSVTDRMWEEVIGAMKNKLNFWERRILNLKGKILIVNVLMLTKMWYILSVVPMPNWFEKRVKEYVMDFIWEKKTPRIAYNTLIGRPEEGGLGLVDVEQKKRSMRVKVVKKYLDVDVKGDWKSTMKHFLAKCGKGFLSDNILWMKLKNWMMEGIPNFYKEVLGAWSFFLKDIDFKPIGREVVLNQPIFLNKNIVFNGKEIFFKKWWEVGIRQVRDVLYEVKDGFLPIQVIIDAMEEGKEEYRKSSLQKQYEEVKSAVPKEWLNEIRKTGETERKVDVCMKIEDKVVEFNLCNVRMFYHCFIKYI